MEWWMSCGLLGVGCLMYAYALVLQLPLGMPRLLALLPWLPLLLTSPWNVPTVHLRAVVSFFFLWMLPFKLLLLCYKAPCTDACSSFPRFVAAMTISPISQQHGHKQKGEESQHSYRWWGEWVCGSLEWHAVMVRAAGKLGLVVTLFQAYAHRDELPVRVLHLLYSIHIYLACSLIFEALDAIWGATMAVHLEPQFDRPFMARSLSEFWGRRWNRLVSSVLRACVYQPLRQWGSGIGVASMAVFLVSGLMHELIFLFINKSTTPTWQVTSFFLVHGVATITEKRCFKGGGLGRAATLSFIFCTASLLFFPPIHNTGACFRALSEFENLLHHVSLQLPKNHALFSCVARGHETAELLSMEQL